MSEEWYEMKYDEDLECWFVTIYQREELLICGNWINLRISKNNGIPCRLELAEDWYLILGAEGVRLNLHHEETYKVQI